MPDASTSLTSVFNYDESNDGSTESRTYVSKQSGVTAAKATVSGTSALSELTWAPGLYLAALLHGEDLSTASVMSTTGSDGSTPTTRASNFGSGVTYETVVAGSNSAKQAVMQVLIGDTDSGAGRNKMLSSAYTQTGISQVSSDSQGSITIIDYASNSYVTASPWAECQEEVEEIEVEEEFASSLVSGAAAFIAALAILQ